MISGEFERQGNSSQPIKVIAGLCFGHVSKIFLEIPKFRKNRHFCVVGVYIYLRLRAFESVLKHAEGLPVSCFLFLVSCSLCLVPCFLFLVSCFLFLVSSFLFLVSCLSFVGCCWLCVVCCLLFVVCCWLFVVVCCLLVVVCCLLFVVRC